MPTPRYALAVGGANGVLYAIGGSNRGYSVASVEAFVPNAPPTAGDVAIIGTPAVGQRLTGVYRYADADGDAEGTSKFRWLRDGIAIGAATARTYDVGPADPGRTLAFEVTPVASSGASPGVAVASAGTGFVAGKTATLAAGGLHTCAVTGSGAVWCWGNNQSGQLGDGTVPARLTPGPVSGLRTGAVTLAAGAFHTCAVTSGGILRCWGDNWHGQLGDGTTTDRLTPVPVSGLGSVVAVVAGWRHTCALTSAGEVWCWGDNSNGQLGDGTMTDRLTPVPVSGLDSGVVAVAAGSGHTCALTSAGEVSCWGYNGQAQLGDGTMTNRLTPVPVSGLDSGVVAVAAGASVTCALTDAGEAWCWGSNSNGQLGDGSVMERSTPVPVSGLENDVVAVAAGGHHACAHTSAGEVSCWGYNGEAQLGDGTTTDLLTPVPVSGLGSVVAVAAGSYQTCAQMRNGAVSCWGWNSQLGDAAMRIRLTPEPVLSLEGFFADGANDDVLGLQTRLALLNPHDVATSASLEFLTTGGSSVTHGPVSLAAQQRLTLDTWTDVPGLANTGFSTIVRSSELSVVADRTMRWDGRGAGAHAETGRTTPSSTWYLAEGATIHSFALSYHVQNPNSVPATVTVRYLLSAGAPVEKRYEVPARSGITIPVNAETVEGVSLANRELSAVLTTSPSTPVLVERSMYLAAPGEVVTGGHASAGVTAPAERWFLAEGATGPFFDLFVLVANPGDAAAQIEVTYLLPDGTTVIKPYTVAAGSRFNIWVDYEDARLADTAVALSVRSANGVPVLVERAMWWPVAAATWYEGHNSPGTTTTGTKWALAEGEVGGPREVETYLLIANPSATTGTVQVTLLFEDGTSAKRTFAVLATSRFNVDVGTEFPEARDRRFGAIVESLGPRLPTPEPIVVERSMYWNAGGKTWAAGTNALATKLQ
jgi:alpha-tubulin suppressor-like RCC1 family protein